MADAFEVRVTDPEKNGETSSWSTHGSLKEAVEMVRHRNQEREGPLDLSYSVVDSNGKEVEI